MLYDHAHGRLSAVARISICMSTCVRMTSGGALPSCEHQLVVILRKYERDADARRELSSQTPILHIGVALDSYC